MIVIGHFSCLHELNVNYLKQYTEQLRQSVVHIVMACLRTDSLNLNWLSSNVLHCIIVNMLSLQLSLLKVSMT